MNDPSTPLANDPAPDPRHGLPQAAPEAAQLPPALVNTELRRITMSRAFSQSRQHQRLLRHLVEHTLAGDTAALKESVLAFEVFRRPIAGFDPSRDTIVRVEARRLRQRLERYYDGEGSDAEIEIGLPVGSYVPVLRRRLGNTSTTEANVPPAVKDLVERGHYFLRQSEEASFEKALDRFDAALREAPDYAPAYLGAGRAWLNLVGEVLRPPMPSIDHATEALQRAVQLDPRQPEALTLLGSVLHRYHFDWAGAAPRFRRAIELAPQSAFTHMGYGAHLVLELRFDDAEAELAEARRLDPHYLNARWQMLLLQVARRRYEDAHRELAALLDLAPGNVPALHMVGALALYQGRPADALMHYRRVDELAPQRTIGLAGIAQAFGQLGEPKRAAATLDELKRRFAGRYVSPYQLALIELRRGQADAALRRLEEALATRDANMIFALGDPALDALRGDARFVELMHRHRGRRDIGVPQGH